MDCPSCDRELTRWTSPSLEVDVCDGGCGGIWFDHYELSRLDEAAEAAGAELLDVPRDPALRSISTGGGSARSARTAS